MNSKRGLMTVLVGLAMLATPIAAAAKDYHHGWLGNYAGPAAVTRHNGAVWAPAPVVINKHDWHGHRGWENANAYRNYGGPGYYAAPSYVAAPVYPVAAPYAAAPYYGGGLGGYGGGAGCGGASRVMRTYARDRATGHPAAAADVLRQNQWAMHSGCASGASAGRGLFGRRGANRGVPAYTNNGGYGNYGYGQQPYGGRSTFAPLMQYFH